MKDKLIKIISEYMNLESMFVGATEKFADHLLENGVIVLPCKLNSRVYDITEFIEECPCPDMYAFLTDEIIISRCRKTKELIFSIDGIDYTFDEFGTRVFSTEKEADVKISELLETAWNRRANDGT